MSRTWRAERSTSKKTPQKGPQKPRVTDFAREYYQGQGYQVEATVTPLACPCGAIAKVDCDHKDEFCGLSEEEEYLLE